MNSCSQMLVRLEYLNLLWYTTKGGWGVNVELRVFDLVEGKWKTLQSFFESAEFLT